MVSAPKPSDWGFDVTIAIVAMTDDDQIVTVSDRMISYDDITQAEDNAVLKARRIASAWGILFAAADARMFYPIVDKLLDRLKPIERPSHDQIKEEGAAAYQEVFEIEFASRFLSRHGYKNISEFRKFGLSELGPEVFGRLHQELLKFDLGIQLLCYGYSEKGHPHIIEIENPGRAIDHDLLRYAIIGSGYWMAAASLRRRPMKRDLTSTIYRLLTGVGKSTAVLTFCKEKDRDVGAMHPAEIEGIREVWEKTLKLPDPKDAIDIIKNSHAVTLLWREGSRVH